VSLEARRPRTPDRIADVIAYLLSDQGQRLTGQVIRVGDPGLRP
jgi:NAD(P)-dependent dehydrogenase (short-subunit alcohol dehydrogenase family)